MKTATESRMELEAKYAELVSELGGLLAKMHGDEAVSEERLEMVSEDLANAANDALETPVF